MMFSNPITVARALKTVNKAKHSIYLPFSK